MGRGHLQPGDGTGSTARGAVVGRPAKGHNKPEVVSHAVAVHRDTAAVPQEDGVWKQRKSAAKR